MNKLANAIAKTLETSYDYSNIAKTVDDCIRSDAQASLFGTAMVRNGRDYCTAFCAAYSAKLASLPNSEHAAFMLNLRVINFRVAVSRLNTDFGFSVSGLTLTIIDRKPKAEKTAKTDESVPTAAESAQADAQADKTVQASVKQDSPEVAALKVEIAQLRESLRAANRAVAEAIKERDEARNELEALHNANKPQPTKTRKPQAAAEQAAA